jgi:hypothetical protein
VKVLKRTSWNNSNLSPEGRVLRRKEWNRQTSERYRKKHPERFKGNQLRFDKNHPGRREEIARSYYVRQLEKKAGRPRPLACEICGKSFEDRNRFRGHFDHDHKTGKFRGWTCLGCNVALGHVNDSIDRLRLLIAYLEKHA